MDDRMLAINREVNYWDENVQRLEAKLERLRRARRQQRAWFRQAEKRRLLKARLEKERLARLERMKNRQGRAARRQRNRREGNKPVIPTPIEDGEVRPADPAYVDQLIPEKQYSEEIVSTEPIVPFDYEPQPFHPGRHVIEDDDE
jgi:uncharacterized membrane protein YgaE (UPF0421/DUF939 family)